MKHDHCTQTKHLLLPILFFLKFKTEKTWQKCIIIERMVTPSPPPKRSACGIKAAVPHVQEWKIGTHKVKGFFTPKIKQKSNKKTKTKKANQWTITPFPPASPCGILPGPLWRTFQVTAEGKRFFYPNWEHLMYTRIMSREKAQSSKTCLEINRSVITS